MKHYLITWQIDIYANGPEEAARAARQVQERPDTTAQVFRVKDKETGKTIQIDLIEEGADLGPDEETTNTKES